MEGSRGEEARRAAHVAGEAGAVYLDGGVQTGPDSIGTEAATLLYSGPRSAFDTSHIHSLVRERIEDGRGHEGLSSIIDSPPGA